MSGKLGNKLTKGFDKAIEHGKRIAKEELDVGVFSALSTSERPSTELHSISLEELSEMLPNSLQSKANQQFLNKVNNIITNPLEADLVRDNVIGYMSIMSTGRYSIDQYLNAVRYASFKAGGQNNKTAYANTFPLKHANFVDRGLSAKDISAYVSAYNNSKLVQALIEQIIIPSWLRNQDIYQETINKLFTTLLSTKSEHIIGVLGNILLTHTAAPQEAMLKVEATVTQGDSALDALKASASALPELQINALKSGTSGLTVEQMINGDMIVDGEVIEQPLGDE